MEGMCYRYQNETIIIKGYDVEFRKSVVKTKKCWLPEIVEERKEEKDSESSSSSISELMCPEYKVLFRRERLTPGKCEDFASYEEIAFNVVDSILEEAASILSSKYEKQVIDCTSKVSVTKNIEWPKIEEFTPDLGIIKIGQYLDFTARVKENWLYYVALTAQSSDPFCDYYVYEAKFSIPTPRYPIPQVGVGIFFGIEVSKVIPSTCQVRVSYFLEGMNTVYHPEKTRITDQMLIRIADSKLRMFRKFKW